MSGICDRGKVCFDFKCKMNRFKKIHYVEEFADMGEFTLGLPQKIENMDALWFNEGEYEHFWRNFVIPNSGGVLKYDESKQDNR